ncbi:helix-turn-helix domain-containing protein [Desulfonatronovibrio magnus]|uniref:helix-turn-helix domain-containing protein n=1 Tax=Desulfonatronovibrio magnus TaxID=698827 RepID=UPI0005EADF88|nr:helix-turn-helix transcriptional regulator [Desulfonatronovibrio magnus]
MSWQGQQIKKLAEKKKLTLKSVAAQVGVSRQALNDWARGQVPKGGHLLKLCKTLEVAPDAFFSSDRDSRITVPMHRARKTAKLTDSMQEKAKDLAAGYELLFREASDPGLVQSLRIYNKTEAEISKASSSLRKLSGVENDAPMNFHHILTLLKNLGVNLIFSDFHEKIKAYAFYTKINNHRVVFVNFKTKAFDFIFSILHEAIHSIRDESDAYKDSLLYDSAEESFCDEVASHAQLTNEYFSFVLETIQGLNKNDQLSQLARFAKKNHHTMHAIQKRIGAELPDFGDNLYRVETKLRKGSPTMREILFKTKDARGYVELWEKVSPIYLGHVIEQSDKLSTRRLCELLSIDSEIDAIEVKAELVRIKSVG